MNNDLERIGDLAVNIAKRALSFYSIPTAEMPVNLRPLCECTKNALGKSLDALIRLDADLAAAGLAYDDVIDEMNRENHAKLIELIDAGTINRPTARDVFEKVFAENVDPEAYVEANGLKIEADDGALKGVIEEIVAANPQSVADYHAGKKKAIGFLVGQTMKAMKGKADPGTVNKILAEILNQ